MYLIRFRDGTVVGTSTRLIADYLWEKYWYEVTCYWFCENLDEAEELCDYVEE